MSNGENDTAALDSDVVSRIQNALTAGSDELFSVMRDSVPDVLKAAIRNPALKEAHLLALLERRDLQGELLKSVGNSRVVRESRGVRIALAHNPAISSAQLSELLPHLYLFELVTICTLPGGTHDQKIAAERAILKRLPTTPLGIKITLAHRATATVVEQLLREGDSRLMSACLDNPHLKEGAVFQFLRSSASTPETISIIARHPRWHNLPNLKLAILTNARTPVVWFVQWLHCLKAPDLRNIFTSQRLSQMQRREVQAELKRRAV